MSDRHSVSVMTYNGVDGACAAAMALLKRPEAEVIVTSAARVGRTMSELAERPKPPSEIYVCGLGVYCAREELSVPALKLGEKGSAITWYCRRGYVDDRKDEFAATLSCLDFSDSSLWGGSSSHACPGDGWLPEGPPTDGKF